MKKLNNLLLLILLLLTFSACIVEKTGKVVYYQLKNDTGEEIKLINSYFFTSSGYCPDSIILPNNESSPVFYETVDGYRANDTFLIGIDSMNICINNILVRVYKQNEDIKSKTPLLTEFYTTIVIGSEGEEINVYTFLSEDFE